MRKLIIATSLVAASFTSSADVLQLFGICNNHGTLTMQAAQEIYKDGGKEPVTKMLTDMANGMPNSKQRLDYFLSVIDTAWLYTLTEPMGNTPVKLTRFKAAQLNECAENGGYGLLQM